MSREDVISRLHEDCSDEMLGASLRLVDYVFENAQQISHLTFTKIAQVIGSDDRRVLFAAVQYLSGSKAQVLEVKYELIIGDRCEVIDESILAHAAVTQRLIDPETGEPVADYQSKIYPFFVPGRAVSEALFNG